MTERIIRPNRHSHPSKGGSKIWPKKTADTKVWPKPKFTPVDVDPAKMGINPDEENTRDEEQNKTLPEVQGS